MSVPSETTFLLLGINSNVSSYPISSIATLNLLRNNSILGLFENGCNYGFISMRKIFWTSWDGWKEEHSNVCIIILWIFIQMMLYVSVDGYKIPISNSKNNRQGKTQKSSSIINQNLYLVANQICIKEKWVCYLVKVSLLV
jgi:hypothetical protein